MTTASMTSGIATNPLPPVKVAWVMEMGGWIVFALVAAYLGVQWWRRGKPSIPALLFIACWSMFWQEFYADWGAYLFYSPDLHLLPWGRTPFTTPNKPLYVVPGYGWFWSGFFFATLALFAKARRRWPDTPYLVLLGLVVLLPFYCWNLLTADGLAYITNWYQYLVPVGPAIVAVKGALPYIYPAIPFIFFAPAVVASIDRVDDQGRPWFERLLAVPMRIDTGMQRLHQVIAWCVGMNLMYATFLTVPLLAIRILFLPDNVYVP